MYRPVVEPVLDQIISHIRPVETWTNMHQVLDKTPLCVFMCVCVCGSIYLIVPVAVVAEKQRRIHLKGSRRGDVQSVAAHTNMQTYAYIVPAVVSVCLPFTLHHITVTAAHNRPLLQKHPQLLTSSCVDCEHTQHCASFGEPQICSSLQPMVISMLWQTEPLQYTVTTYQIYYGSFCL